MNGRDRHQRHGPKRFERERAMIRGDRLGIVAGIVVRPEESGVPGALRQAAGLPHLLRKAGAAVGVDDRRVKGDAKRFKEFIESRGTETGGWRGRN